MPLTQHRGLLHRGDAVAGALASATLVNTGALTGCRWHHYARIWTTPVLGEVFQSTASRPAFWRLPGRENARLTREQIDRIYDASGSGPPSAPC